MKTITVPEQEFLQLQQTLADLQQAVQALQAQLISLLGKKNGHLQPEGPPTTEPKVTWKRGSGKHLIAYMADDFNAPLSD